MRRRERDLLPALLRRARRLPRLRDEHWGRQVGAVARGRAVRAALHSDDQRGWRHDRGPLEEGARRAHVGDRLRPHLPQGQIGGWFSLPSSVLPSLFTQRPRVPILRTSPRGGSQKLRAYILNSSDLKDSPSRSLAACTNSGWLTIWRTSSRERLRRTDR